MDYKMVVIDLDGTLLNDKKVISEEDVQMLNKLHNNGIEIVIATGRNFYMAKKLIQQIKNINPVILANNGTIIRLSSNDELLDFNYLDSGTFEIIYNLGLEHNLHPIIHVDEYLNGYDIIYNYDQMNELIYYVKRYEKRAKFLEFKPSEVKNILSVCYFDEFDKLNKFNEELKNNNNVKLNTIFNVNVSDKVLLEYLHFEGCKWSSLKKYINKKNISPEEIISFGDDNNDIELIANSGMGIAMRNAVDGCIRVAKKISEFDNNNSGVSFELKKLFNY